MRTVRQYFGYGFVGEECSKLYTTASLEAFLGTLAGANAWHKVIPILIMNKPRRTR